MTQRARSEFDLKIPSFETNLNGSIEKIDSHLSSSLNHLHQFIEQSQPKTKLTSQQRTANPGHVVTGWQCPPKEAISERITLHTLRGQVFIDYNVKEARRWFRASKFTATLVLDLTQRYKHFILMCRVLLVQFYKLLSHLFKPFFLTQHG